VGLDLLAHLDLLLVTLLRVHLCAEAAQILGLLGGIVAFTGGTLAGTLVVVEAAFISGLATRRCITEGRWWSSFTVCHGDVPIFAYTRSEAW
jgi:hypothetical protein